MTNLHSGIPKSGPFLFLGYDIQSPAPGVPMQTQRGPRNPSSDPTNDPMGHLDARPYDYGTMVNNLVSHYNGANEGERKQGRLWYKAAHDLFHTFAKDRNISPEKAVGYGAAFSPLTDWGDNVHHAQQFLLGYDPHNNPNHNEHDWQTAHINPAALQQFRDENGRDPSESDDDLHRLADLHADAFKRGPGSNATNDLSDPAGTARANWIGNIQHKGMQAILEDHARQADAWSKMPAGKKGTVPYNPSMAMRPSGINTLGGNIQKAKDVYNSPDDAAEMFRVLGGPKISHFTDNILDDTPINSEGYYQHPNGDWRQNKDLGGTIDSHHIRAASMPHGGWERKAYASKNPSTNHEYDVFNRGLLDATSHINSQEPDPTKHITPKQLQAITWLKHKNDKDFFERQRNPQTGAPIQHESELQGMGRPEDWQFAEKSYKSKGKGLGKGPSRKPRAAALTPEDFHNLPPLWRKLFMSRQPQEWTELLKDYTDHVSPPSPNLHHEGAVIKDWTKATPDPEKPVEAQTVSRKPRTTPRRPNAPKRIHRGSNDDRWYLGSLGSDMLHGIGHDLHNVGTGIGKAVDFMADTGSPAAHSSPAAAINPTNPSTHGMGEVGSAVSDAFKGGPTSGGTSLADSYMGRTSPSLGDSYLHSLGDAMGLNAGQEGGSSSGGTNSSGGGPSSSSGGSSTDPNSHLNNPDSQGDTSPGELAKQISSVPFVDEKGNTRNFTVSPDQAASVQKAWDLAGVHTPEQKASWLAQSGIESDGWNTTTQYGAEANDNGATAPNGQDYRGRGRVQLTHQDNYQDFGNWAKNKGLVSDPNTFVNNPGQVADPKWADIAQAYYWDKHNLNQRLQDRGNLGVSQDVNGGDAFTGTPNSNNGRQTMYNDYLPLFKGSSRWYKTADDATESDIGAPGPGDVAGYNGPKEGPLTIDQQKAPGALGQAAQKTMGMVPGNSDLIPSTTNAPGSSSPFAPPVQKPMTTQASKWYNHPKG